MLCWINQNACRYLLLLGGAQLDGRNNCVDEFGQVPKTMLYQQVIRYFIRKCTTVFCCNKRNAQKMIKLSLDEDFQAKFSSGLRFRYGVSWRVIMLRYIAQILALSKSCMLLP